jgi:hypothetical protein
MRTDPVSSVGWFVETAEDTEFIRYMTRTMNVFVHLSFYERHTIDESAQFLDCREYINSVHLPNELSVSDFKAGGVVQQVSEFLDVKLFNIHPWCPDLVEIIEEVLTNHDYTLCLETFKLKTDKIGNVMRQLAQFGGYMLRSDRIGLTLDLTHLEPEVMNYTFVRGVLPFVKIIHMSQTVGKKKHQPIFTGVQSENASARRVVGSILSLREFPVQEIVLEYEKEFKRMLYKHSQWLTNFIIQKRRKFQ